MPMRVFSYRGILIDFLCVALLGLTILLLIEVVPPFQRGFFCDDESIRYPVPKSQTVSDTTVGVVALLSPVFVVLVTEICHAGFSTPTSLVLFGWTPPVWVVQSYAYIGIFLFGGGVEQTTVEAGKRMVGRLRPHFYQACLPMGLVCNQTSTHQYIEQYTCSGNPDVIHEARMSFPSGHSALSFYAATFLAIYFQSRISTKHSKLLKHLLQFLVYSAAWFTALSRVADYMHHPTDVIAGIVLGTIVGTVTTIFVSDFRRQNITADTLELTSLMNKPPTLYSTTDNNAISSSVLP